MTYSKINPLRYSPEEIEKREEYRCEHRHNGIRHAACYNKAYNIKERVGCLDIETGNLCGDFDIMYCWCIKTISKKELFWDCLNIDDLESGLMDKRIVENCIIALWHYDRIVTHYGNKGRFDVPFLRTRALYHNLDFPTYGMIWQSDTYTMAKNLLKLQRYRQGNIAETILGRNIKTRVDPKYWLAVKYGTQKEKEKALSYILKHCKKDVIQLEQNYLKLKPFVKEVRGSI